MQRQAALCVIIKKVKNMTEILATLGYLKFQMIMIFIRQIICLKLITSIMIIMKLLKIWETNLLGEIIKVEISNKLLLLDILTQASFLLSSKN